MNSAIKLACNPSRSEVCLNEQPASLTVMSITITRSDSRTYWHRKLSDFSQ